MFVPLMICIHFFLAHIWDVCYARYVFFDLGHWHFSYIWAFGSDTREEEIKNIYDDHTVDEIVEEAVDGVPKM